MTAAAHRTVTVAHLVLAVINLVSNASAETTTSYHVSLIGNLDMKEPPVRLQSQSYLANGLEANFRDERMLRNNVNVAKVPLE